MRIFYLFFSKLNFEIANLVWSKSLFFLNMLIFSKQGKNVVFNFCFWLSRINLKMFFRRRTYRKRTLSTSIFRNLRLAWRIKKYDNCSFGCFVDDFCWNYRLFLQKKFEIRAIANYWSYKSIWCWLDWNFFGFERRFFW